MPRQEPKESAEKGLRIDIPYFDGVNGAVGHVLAKKTELAHAENARCEVIGTIQKRAGQSITGTTTSGTRFYTNENYGLAHFENDSQHSLYRISQANLTQLAISVSDELLVREAISISGPGTVTPPLQIWVKDTITTTESVMDGIASTATVYYLDENSSQWNALTGSGTGIPAAKFSHVVVDDNLFLVNGYSNNRYINSTGTTVVDSSSGAGHLFNSPNAKKIAFYKNRIYLANFKKDFLWYKTTVLRSSYPLGIVATLAEDFVDVAATNLLKVTDNKYFFADSGANSYEIWRGPTKICDITIDQVNETTIKVATVSPATPDLLASDEIWVAGTYTGEKKFRWVGNTTSGGKDVKLYDSFRISGGDNDEIKMLATIGDVLMVSNNNSLSTWNDYTLQTLDLGIGCVSHNGYVKTYGSLYFLHYTGIYTTSGGIPSLISQKVRRYIEGATKAGLEAAAAGKKGKSVFFKIGTVTLYYPDGSVEKTLYNTALEYSIPENNWYVHTNVVGDQFETHRTSSNLDMLEMTDTVGARDVTHFLDPETTTDKGTEIPFRIDLNDFSLQGTFENISHPYAVVVEADRGAAMEAFARINREKYYKLNGVVKKGISVLKVNNKDDKRGQPPPARLFTVSIRDVSKQICKLDRISILHIPSLAADESDQ